MVSRPSWSAEATVESHRVTTLELFFDLVFVFALTQVTALMAGDTTLRGVGRGMVVLALLWFAWTSYAWLGNQVRADEGTMRAVIVAAMCALFVVALAIPDVFTDLDAQLIDPLVFALFYIVVRLIHFGSYLQAASGDAVLRRQLLRTSIWVAPALALLVVGALLPPRAQTIVWIIAVLIDYGAVYITSSVKGNGWRLNAPAHWAERHGLIIIIALGESVVAVGAGLGNRPLTCASVLAAILGLGIALCLWWLYFDVVALVAERVLTRLQGNARAALARDSYTYLHLLMVAGIVLLALGLKKSLGYVADTETHGPGAVLTGVPLVALYGGVALYLFGHLLFRSRNVRSINPQRVVVLVVVLALIPVAWHLPVIVSLALLTAVLTALVGYEALHFSDARYKIRHAAEDEPIWGDN